MTDVETTITAIGLGLKLVDQFRDLALKFIGHKPSPPGAIAEQAGSAIEIRSQGTLVTRVTGADMHLNQIDSVRYNTLEKRVNLNWTMFNKLDEERILLATDEQIRIKMRMDKIKDELCGDLREMVGIYERVLGVSLPDHYSLSEVCVGS